MQSSTSSAAPPPGNNGADTGLKARYAAALQEAILAKWTRPETVPVGARCRLVIRQLPGGEVMSAEVSSPCAYDEQGRRSIEAAVLKAQPLPYAGFETGVRAHADAEFPKPATADPSLRGRLRFSLSKRSHTSC